MTIRKLIANKSILAVALVGTCAGLGGFYAAYASTPRVAPPTPPLFYSGFLSQGGAAAPSGNHSIQVAVFSTLTGGTAIAGCSGGSSAVPVVAGHFSIPMSSGCATAIDGSRTLFAEVTVEGTMMTPRTQIGAMPYALQAESADVASSVDFKNVTNDGSAVWPGSINGPTILGSTGALASGSGADESGVSLGHGYKNLTAMCVASFGKGFPCTVSDATRSMARGQFGNVFMSATDWVIGGVDDCSGFTDDSAGNGTAIQFQVLGQNPVAFPNTSACTSQHPVLCCSQ